MAAQDPQQLLRHGLKVSLACRVMQVGADAPQPDLGRKMETHKSSASEPHFQHNPHGPGDPHAISGTETQTHAPRAWPHPI